MGLIYNRAMEVCLWLGMPEYLGMILLQNLNSEHLNSDHLNSNLISDLGFESFSNFLESKLQVSWDGSINASMWHELDLLCNKTYWGRLWINQEIILAPKINVYLGDEVLSWDKLSIALLGNRNRKPVFESQAFRLCEPPQDSVTNMAAHS
jgi:hypothetical protein